MTFISLSDYKSWADKYLVVLSGPNTTLLLRSSNDYDTAQGYQRALNKILGSAVSLINTEKVVNDTE